MRSESSGRALRATRPNAGVRSAYRKALDKLIAAMASEYHRVLVGQYDDDPPVMAQDAKGPKKVSAVQTGGVGGQWRAYVDGEPLRSKAGPVRWFKSKAAAEAAGLKAAGSTALLTEARAWGDFTEIKDLPLKATPAEQLNLKLDVLGAKWQERFDTIAPRLADVFTAGVDRATGASIKSILRDGGMTVRLQMTPAMRDITAATVAENVSLIKSISSQYHTEVQGLVMRSVTAGRDLGGLSKELRKRYGITKRRAALISLDQNNKATSAFNQARQIDLGIEEGVWMHSHAGREPRPTHVAMDLKRFKIAEGMFDPDPRVKRRIMPGELIRCRCTWKPVVKGLS